MSSTVASQMLSFTASIQAEVNTLQLL